MVETTESLTPDELAELRRVHVPRELVMSTHRPKPVWCAHCGSFDSPWPCTITRLLVASLRSTSRDSEVPPMSVTDDLQRISDLASAVWSSEDDDELRRTVRKISGTANAALASLRAEPSRDSEVPAGNERARAVTLATWALDDASRDPDSDLSVLARQFFREIDRAAAPSEVREAIDVERLARALHESEFHQRYHGDLDDTDRAMAADLAARYEGGGNEVGDEWEPGIGSTQIKADSGWQPGEPAPHGYRVVALSGGGEVLQRIEHQTFYAHSAPWPDPAHEEVRTR